MFNIKYYKFFNPDLNNLNNIQISNHWNIVGKKENRVYSIDTFMSKYPNFNIKKYRGFNNDIKNLDDIELMAHYHLKGINENRIFTNDQFYNLYPNFNIDQYKKFIKNIKLLNDDDYIYKWHNEYNNIINTENELVDKIEVSEIIQESDILDQQILNAAILGSAYQIPEPEIVEEKKSKNNKVSFVDWFDRIEKGDLNDEEFEFRRKAEKIIDQFLAKQPKIKIKKEPNIKPGFFQEFIFQYIKSKIRKAIK